ncbi:MAG: Rab family GTPase [Candidatus Thorarchaeota archaeon]
MAKEPNYYYEFKILLVGNPAVGKTSLILKYVENRFEREYKASIGVDFAYKIIELEEKVARLIIWDIASQERFAPYRTSFYKQTDGAMLVFDLTRPDTLEAIEEWIREIHQDAGEVKVLLIGNKADLKKKRAIKKEEVQSWIDRYGWKYIETSAMTGDGVDEAFKILTEAIIEKIEQ